MKQIQYINGIERAFHGNSGEDFFKSYMATLYIYELDLISYANNIKNCYRNKMEICIDFSKYKQIKNEFIAMRLFVDFLKHYREDHPATCGAIIGALVRKGHPKLAIKILGFDKLSVDDILEWW